MGTGYESTLHDIVYLFDVASVEDRNRVLRFVHATVRERNAQLAFFDDSGAAITLAEIHRRTQLDPEIQRSVYNMWMTYAH
jgi:hypothetical protein